MSVLEKNQATYKESSKESSSSNWQSSQPFVASNKPVNSSSAIIWLTGSITTLWFGIDEGTDKDFSKEEFVTAALLLLLLLLSFFAFFVVVSFLTSSIFSISVSPQIEMFERILCFLSPVLCDGLYLFVFFVGFGASWGRCLGTRTVRLDLLLDLLDSSRRSRSSLQKPPLPGSSFERATFTKHLFRDRLWRMEFCKSDFKKAYFVYFILHYY